MPAAYEKTRRVVRRVSFFGIAEGVSWSGRRHLP